MIHTHLTRNAGAALVLLLLACTTIQAAYDESIRASMRWNQEPYAIDGDLSDFQGTLYEAVGSNPAQVAFMFDLDYFYIGIRVHSSAEASASSSALAFQLADAETTTSFVVGRNSYWIFQTDGTLLTNNFGIHAYKDEPDGYSVEFAVPLAVLGWDEALPGDTGQPAYASILTITLPWQDTSYFPNTEFIFGRIYDATQPSAFTIEYSKQWVEASGGTGIAKIVVPYGTYRPGLGMSEGITVDSFSEDGTIHYTVAANSGSYRSVTLYYGGASLRLRQYGPGGGNPWDFEDTSYFWGDCYSWIGYFRFDAAISGAQTVPHYIQHSAHGPLAWYGERADSMFFYDFSLESWWWTGEGIYPYLYLFDASQPRWLWHWVIPEPIDPGLRWFYDFSKSEWTQAVDM
ncbi:MAG: hypothetical protein SFY80_15265 [Verrucomicrobiota bacterium]|nr:hypothetical protein [Verrucomicrobiota bacterium]